MIETSQKFGYMAYGFKIESEFPHPGFSPWRVDADDGADVIVKFGDLSSTWARLASSDDDYCICKENLVMFRIPDVATYLISDGNQIIVSPVEGAAMMQVRLFLDGYCMAVILLQRRILPLHGSAVAINGKAYAIIGRSGAGKSTLTKAFLKQGHAFLCDDIIPVHLAHKSGDIMVSPSFPEQKLWEESLHEFGMGSGTYDPIYEREIVGDAADSRRVRTKFAIPVSRYVDKPMPLAGILELAKTDCEEEVGISSQTKNEQLRAAMHHTFHRALIADLGMLEWHFKTAVELVNRIEIVKLLRSRNSFSAPELVSSILKRIDEESL